MNDHDDRLFEALSSLGEREWRAPDLDAIRKERTMRTRPKHPSIRLAIGVGVALLAASAVGAATWYAGVFKGVITDEDGNKYQVELREVDPGVFEGESEDGHQIRFITEDAAGTVELTVPEGSGETTFEMDTSKEH
jgi:hypothetical protein